MTSTANGAARVEEALEARSKLRGGMLTANVEKLRYANRYLYDKNGKKSVSQVLYVGVGHGLDAILALSDGDAEQIVGVDPYIAADGNDAMDFEILSDLVSELRLKGKFRVHKAFIQDFHADDNTRPDRIIINDVLHHIFETAEELPDSSCFSDAVTLFDQLFTMAAPGACLVVGDVSRHGLRPMLGRLKLFRGRIDYKTKQDWQAWDAAAKAGGWQRIALENYVPWRFRNFRRLLSGRIARFSVCEKYYLYYGKPDIEKLTSKTPRS